MIEIRSTIGASVSTGGDFAGLVETARGNGPDDAVTFWGYLATALVLLPVAAAWAFAERTRWSSVVLLVAALTVVVMQWRLVQVWNGA